jgi:hypothetical protein
MIVFIGMFVYTLCSYIHYVRISTISYHSVIHFSHILQRYLKGSTYQTGKQELKTEREEADAERKKQSEEEAMDLNDRKLMEGFIEDALGENPNYFSEHDANRATYVETLAGAAKRERQALPQASLWEQTTWHNINHGGDNIRGGSGFGFVQLYCMATGNPVQIREYERWQGGKHATAPESLAARNNKYDTCHDINEFDGDEMFDRFGYLKGNTAVADKLFGKETPIDAPRKLQGMSPFSGNYAMNSLFSDKVSEKSGASSTSTKSSGAKAEAEREKARAKAEAEKIPKGFYQCESCRLVQPKYVIRCSDCGVVNVYFEDPERSGFVPADHRFDYIAKEERDPNLTSDERAETGVGKYNLQDVQTGCPPTDAPDEAAGKVGYKSKRARRSYVLQYRCL